MDYISLIANTGIQFTSFKIKLDPDKLRSLKFHYYEGLDTSSDSLQWWFEELIEIKDFNQFILKSDLASLNISRDNLRDEDSLEKIEHSNKTLFDEEAPRTYVIRNADRTLKRFEKQWIPLPYFKSNQINESLFGPTDWVRMWYEILPGNELEIALAVDTTTDNDENQSVSPVYNLNPNENKYDLCRNEDSILSFLSPYTKCEWVANWLNGMFKVDPDNSQTEPLATFVHFLRILNSGNFFPKVQLLSDQSEVIDLDLSIDVGNSHTCAILFETPNEGVVNFNKVKKLQLRDLTKPTKTYADAFSTRIVFRDENFGMKEEYFAQQGKFRWPSPVRIGVEAENLINSLQVEISVQQENKSFYSSPKRYLWDDKLATQPWNFHEIDGEIPKNVYKKGVSEQLKSDGSLCTDGAWGNNPLYPRKTLMTFLFLEIFSQAISQLNSFEFRSTHGKPNARRRLRHVIITCPTAMIKVEQYALRKAANDAAHILKNFTKNLNVLHPTVVSETFEIVPNLRDIQRNLDDFEDKKDWMYDEASCAQLVFLYGLIQHKFDGNPNDLFKRFGHKLKNGKSALTIGSLDIGGGTSDLMINEYAINQENATELIPKPLYFESFHLAGDDLMKNLIQAVIIEGKEINPEDKNCSGVIENKGHELGDKTIHEKLNGFFGKDAAVVSHHTRLMRVNFLNQIGIPLAHKFLDCANNLVSEEFTYENIFIENTPSQDLLTYFYQHFGFKFEDLVWNLSPQKVNSIIRSTFSKLIKQVAKLMHKYHCDFVVISGRPCSFKEINKIFLEIHPVQSNRFINLNDYWIGKWYPFSDNDGYVKDPKTIVATGALIAFMGSKFFKLNRFKIDPKFLKSELKSTANFLGQIRENIISDTVMSPHDNIVKIQVFSVPYRLGIKNVNSKNYPARDLIQIQYNESFIARRNRQNEATRQQDIINGYNAKMPYTITLSREFDLDKEKLIIEDIRDAEDETHTNLFSLRTITLPDEQGYWFDTAEFTLSITSRD